MFHLGSSAVGKFVSWFTGDDLNAVAEEANLNMQNSIDNLEKNLELLLVGDSDGDGIPDNKDEDTPDDGKPNKPGLLQLILEAIKNSGTGGSGSSSDHDPDAFS